MKGKFINYFYNYKLFTFSISHIDSDELIVLTQDLWLILRNKWHCACTINSYYNMLFRGTIHDIDHSALYKPTF